GVEPLLGRDAEPIGELDVAIEELVEFRVEDLGLARAIGGLVVSDLRRERLELFAQRLLVAHGGAVSTLPRARSSVSGGEERRPRAAVPPGGLVSVEPMLGEATPSSARRAAELRADALLRPGAANRARRRARASA